MVYVEQLQNMAENEKTTILVDFGDVEHFDAELAVAIETEYYRFEWSLRAGARAAYDDVVKEDEDDGVDGGSRNFVIFVAFTNLKRAPRKLREMNSSRIGTLSLMKGTVTRTSDVRPELLYGSFTCLKCGMQRTDVEQQLRYTTPTVCLNTSCNNQSSSAWDLDVEGSTFSDWQRIRVQESPDEIPAGSLPRSFDIIVRDAMVERVKAGDKIVATGSLCVMPDASGLARAGESAVAQRTTATPAGDLSQGVTGTKLLGSRELTYKLIFVACSIESVERNRFGKSAPVGKNETTTTQIDDNELLDEDSDEDEEERRIVEEMRTTPQLYDKLAASMAPTIYGHADIKHGVLLQLVGGLHKQTPEGIKLRGDVNVCVVGDPSTAKSQFLKYVHGFSPRAVYTSGKAASAAGLTASIVRDSDTGEFCVEAGALMLADNGICCFPAEDHQLLTNRGFLLLEDVLEHSHSSCEPLKFATFDRSTKQFRYESAQRIVVNEGMQSLVEFTPDDEAAFRATNVHKEPSPCDRPSSDECRRHSASKNIGQTTTNRLSIVATGNHDMYVATGSVGFNGEPRFGDDATFLKVKAHSIADDFDKYSAVRFMAHAEGGLGVSATPSADALRELFEFLVLDTKKKQVAFLECYGFMLSISGRPASFGVDLGSCAIIFRQLDRDGANFLRIRVTTCELDGSRWEETPDKSFGSIETFRFIIRDRRWISTFIGVSDVEARSLAERVARAHGISHNDGAQVDSPSKSPRVVSHISQTPQRRRDEARTGCVTPDFSSRSSRARTSKRSVRETEGDEHVRRLPRWVKALPKDLARALIRGFRSTEYDDDEASLRTSSASLRDDLLIICLHAGYAANFQSVPRRSFDGEGDAATSEWEITCSSKESHTFPTLRNNSTEISHLRQRLCKTWCISVPSSFVVVRRVIKNGDGIVAYASTPTIQGVSVHIDLFGTCSSHIFARRIVSTNSTRWTARTRWLFTKLWSSRRFRSPKLAFKLI